VRATSRLTDSPACLVADAFDLGGNLQRILRSVGQDVPAFKPILEVNPEHPMVLRLKDEEKRFADWAQILFDQALLAEGGQLEDPAGFVKRLNALMLDLAGGGSRIWTPN
jgi:molecular chaperone HtpG